MLLLLGREDRSFYSVGFAVKQPAGVIQNHDTSLMGDLIEAEGTCIWGREVKEWSSRITVPGAVADDAL